MKASKKYRRTSHHLPGYDYTKTGWYFVTICTKYRDKLFGKILDDAVIELTAHGELADLCWRGIPEHFPHVRLDAYIIMPDHLHGILFLTKADTERTKEQFGKPVRGSLSTIVRSYKSAVTHAVNTLQGKRGNPVWQPGFHEHIIGDEKELHAIRSYIRNNPRQWLLDNQPLKTVSSAIRNQGR